MDIAIKSCFATLVVVVVFATANAAAESQVYVNYGNAPAHCQAFTPGPTNTIRNRVTGSENVGATMNVACAFENISSGDYGQETFEAGLRISNSGSTPIAVTCSELSGYFGDAGTVVTKTTPSIAASDSATLDFTSDDTPDPDDTTLGYAVGINCILPTHAVMSETYASWVDEDGV